MRKKISAALLIISITALAQTVPQERMRQIYEASRTPYKYGMVVAPQSNFNKFDCPTIFRQNSTWYMTFVCYDGKDGTDGRGYDTWIAKSDDLLHWQTLGRILQLPTPSTNPLWDENQRGGFPSLIDYEWNGSYEMQSYKNRHWLTYIGGPGTGYEAVNAPLSIGIASTKEDISQPHLWETKEKPLLSYNDRDAQWWEHLTQYKSTIYWIRNKKERIKGQEKFPFVMFYNAGGKDDSHPKGERIGIALSKNLRKWKRYEGNPVFAHDTDGTITGDAQIVRMDDVWVMFYFSAYNPTRKYNAYNTFAASYDLVNWTDWNGEDLIVPSKPYDEMFAHKSCVIKYQGVVYHFYCAVNNAGQRGIALATSLPLGRSDVSFPQPEPTGKRIVTSLNDQWKCQILGNSTIQTVNLPHNLDDYYGYRQLRHGNLHGSALYDKSFILTKKTDKRYFLQLEGIGTFATITLNEHTYPKELIGRTSFTLDITDALRNGENQLHILVDHPAMQTESPWVCGGCSSEWGFSEGSQPFGIFRPVSLIETDAIRIQPFGVHIWNNLACDTVFIETEVKNYTSEAQEIELVNKFAMASGKQAFRHAVPLTLKPGETKTIYHAEPIDNPIRWSIDNPYLYYLTTMVKREGKTTDECRTPFGIRSMSWPLHHPEDHRFFLNNEPVFINGTCEYEHLLGASHAFTHEQISSRIKQIRNAGFNAFREAHQPHNLYYQQLLDQQGILFWSQFSAHIWYDTPQFRENFKRLLVRWIKERRNSPSVILWGLQNESVLPKEFAEECSNIIRQLDPTASIMRPITTCNGGEGTDWNVIQNWSGTYGGSADNYDKELTLPYQLLNGEYGAWRTIDLHGDEKYSEESFTKLLETKARLAESVKDSTCGHFQWLFASHDNPGRVQPDGAYRCIDKIGPINYKGLTTIWEEPTPAYYMYRHRYVGPDTIIPTAANRNVDLVKGNEEWHYLYRLNCGGDCYTDEFGQQWHQDSPRFCHSWGDDFEGISSYQASQRHITLPIQGTKSQELFQYFRFGRHRLWYDFPVPDGDYSIELFFVEPWHGKGGGVKDDYEGMRIFDVAINGETVIDDLDPWAEAGYCGAMKRVVNAKAKNGKLHISFPEVKAGQAIICGIAIATKAPISQGLHECPLSSFLWKACDSDTIAKLPKTLLPQDTELRPATVYEPIKPGTWEIKPGLGQEYALRFRYKNRTGKAIITRMRIVDSKNITIVDRDITFPPTPEKFKMLSTTTGTQINAGTYRLTIDDKNLEFQNIEIQ
ncbi:MAG: beta-galactosidase [Prevotella sp.]|nr:beta-galactosidase [Prevotella sp.]